MRKSSFIFILTVLFSMSLSAETKTVEKVDLTRYLGIWYEIGSIPQKFAKGCHCTRAQYSLKSEGKITVVNTCNKKSINGKLSVAEGRGKVVDKVSNAKLTVSFFWPFSGEYHIIGLDPEYRYAVVSNEVGSTLWILSRTPELQKSLLNQALETAKANGIDMSKFQYMVQKGCSYPKPL